LDLRIGLAGRAAVSDSDGGLWIVTEEPHEFKGFLTRISPDGQQVRGYVPAISLKQGITIDWLTPAAGAGKIAVLANTSSWRGRDITFEGAFFLAAQSDGLGSPTRLAGRGPQFTIMVGTSSGDFIAAGDQDPLTILRLDSAGKVKWRRVLSAKLVLPVPAEGDAGEIFVLSQARSSVLLQVLDVSGRVLRFTSLPGRQGTIVADSGGGCTVLLSTGSARPGERVQMVTLDRELRQLRKAPTPMGAMGGRTYQLVSTPRGHLFAGESPVQKTGAEKVLGEFDHSGEIIWQLSTEASSVYLAPSRDGFYLVEESSRGQGIDVEKYVYR
jgi:hypothetical protein